MSHVIISAFSVLGEFHPSRDSSMWCCSCKFLAFDTICEWLATWACANIDQDSSFLRPDESFCYASDSLQEKDDARLQAVGSFSKSLLTLLGIDDGGIPPAY